jgi:hypothetical protein
MGTRLVEHRRCSFTPYTEKVPHLAHSAPEEDAAQPADCPTCLGCKTESSVESTINVSESPTSSSNNARLKGSSKRRNLRTRRWKEWWSPATPGNRCENKRPASHTNERPDSTSRNCWKSASVMTSESESRLSAVAFPPRVEVAVGVLHEEEQHGHGLFQGRRWGSVMVGYPMFLSVGIRMAPVLLPNHATHI